MDPRRLLVVQKMKNAFKYLNLNIVKLKLCVNFRGVQQMLGFMGHMFLGE